MLRNLKQIQKSINNLKPKYFLYDTTPTKDRPDEVIINTILLSSMNLYKNKIKSCFFLNNHQLIDYIRENYQNIKLVTLEWLEKCFIEQVKYFFNFFLLKYFYFNVC